MALYFVRNQPFGREPVTNQPSKVCLRVSLGHP